MVCFDTDVLSVLLRSSAPAVLLRRLAEIPARDQCTTAVTLGELMFGAMRRANTRLLAEIEEFVPGRLAILPFDERAARAYARIKSELRTSGRPLAEPDLRIAATALSRSAVLVTGNVRHFVRVPGLQVENWLTG